MKNPCSADDLVENFNLKILKVIDVIAPYKVKRFLESKMHPGEKLARNDPAKKVCSKVEHI